MDASNLERTEKLFEFLQGNVPEGYHLDDAQVPKLTPEQAWTVVWYLGELNWKVTDHIERCDVCGNLFDANQEGECLDFGEPPHHFCCYCACKPEYEAKRQSGGGTEGP